MTETTRMKVRGGLSAATIAVVLAFGPPAAMAQLPGGSAVDQYTENVPGAGGDQPSGGGSSATNGGNGTDSSAPATTTPATTPSASASGGSPQVSSAAGNGDAASAGSTPAGGAARAGNPGTLGGSPPEVPATLTSQPVPAATHQPGSSGDISAAWPIALLVVALASVGIYWYRRRYPETLIQRPGRTPQRSLG